MNERKDRKSLGVAVLICGALLLAGASAAVAMDVADVRAYSGGIDFQPKVEYGALVLTVSGPDGSTYRAEFKGGESPAFAIFDKGEVLPDGVYNYQLQVVPSQAKRRDAFEANQAAEKGRGVIEPLVQSGSFSIVNGAAVAGGGEEPDSGFSKPNGIAAKDQVIPDDLIVQGSVCVGFDCVNNESFGFDTIRLKENNTRIKFEDTSSSAGFPSNDWQLTANDSASGGSNKFSIEDITGAKVPFTVTAGAATNSIFVDSTGRVGLRTSTPVLDLHISTTNTPALRLEQTSGGGFTAQTWDIAGNEANFFVRDVTGGSRLPLRIRPGALTSSIDVNANGVGILTTGADTELTVKSGATNSDVIKTIRSGSGVTDTLFRVFEASTGEGVFSVFDAANVENIRFTGQAQGRLAIGCASSLGADLTLNAAGGGACGAGTESTINAGATQFTVTSSRAIKENLQPVQPADILDKIRGVNVYAYDFIDGPKDRLGLMAEDFHTVFGRGPNTKIDGQDVQMALWIAVQQLASENQELKTEVNQKDGAIESLEARLARLENALAPAE